MARLFGFLMLVFVPAPAMAQDLVIGTVTRPPFSMQENGADMGFSIDLWREIADRINADYAFRRFNSFPAMLDAVSTGEIDAAIANISITAEREQRLDFSQPIFSAGLQVMVPADQAGVASIWSIILSRDVGLALLLAFGLLFGGGMLMWRFERGRQPYFDLTARDAMFPSFWWALNLVVNGGFEERMPRSPAGRLFGVVLVISSLFLVSIFVARITSIMTVDAITTSINGLNDLYGKRVGTVEASTAADFLHRRDLRFTSYPDPAPMLDDFAAGGLDAVVFDAPILAYYANTEGREVAQLAGPIFLRENYGIALPSSSDLSEDINRALLNLREDGTYATIHRNWFGAQNQ